VADVEEVPGCERAAGDIVHGDGALVVAGGQPVLPGHDVVLARDPLGVVVRAAGDAVVLTLEA
jgi:hypothetical protein